MNKTISIWCIGLLSWLGSSTTAHAFGYSCVFNNQYIASGSTVKAYATQSVPYGQQCQSQIRYCYYGYLTGTYAYSSCTVQPAPTPPPPLPPPPPPSSGGIAPDYFNSVSAPVTTTLIPAVYNAYPGFPMLVGNSMYVTYSANSTTIAKSTFNGSSWSGFSPVQIAGISSSQNPSVVVLPSLNLQVMFHSSGSDVSLGYSVSSDGGNTWSYRGSVANIHGWGKAFLDKSGEIWLYYNDYIPNFGDLGAFKRLRLSVAANGSLQPIDTALIYDQSGRIIKGGDVKYAFGKYWMVTSSYSAIAGLNLLLSSDGLKFHTFDNGAGVLVSITGSFSYSFSVPTSSSVALILTRKGAGAVTGNWYYTIDKLTLQLN